MNGSKALTVERYARKNKLNFIRFDCRGHGKSEGKFEDFTISDWRKDLLDIIDNIAKGPQVLIGSSMGGWLMMLANATFAWGSKTQTVTALSSTEAEYIALASACAELCAIINQLKQLPFPELATGPHLVLEDNQACIKMPTNPKGWKRTKHIDVRHHFVRDLVESDVVQIQHIGTDLQAADLLTKALHGKLFKKHRAFIMGYDQSS